MVYKFVREIEAIQLIPNVSFDFRAEIGFVFHDHFG